MTMTEPTRTMTVLTSSTVPVKGSSFRHARVLATRSLIKTWRTPEALIDVTLQPVIFLAMFTYIFGGAISGSVSNYLPLIIPGILVQTVITTSVVTGVQLREDMDKGVFDRFKSLPIARIAPLAGALLADTLRYAIATTITPTHQCGTAQPERRRKDAVAVPYVALVNWCAVRRGGSPSEEGRSSNLGRPSIA